MQSQINQLDYDVITSNEKLAWQFKVQAVNFHCTFNRALNPRHTKYLIKAQTNYFRIKCQHRIGQSSFLDILSSF